MIQNKEMKKEKVLVQKSLQRKVQFPLCKIFMQ